ncbi:hypothetical protein SLEP1_g24663 [Rubroshorea leprosula]|uniref:Uncharacterized protein n=1 Tax=Rubroshorea leprosula TaxID=152421 RepID=A0AAV5JRW9_9ROSI|nr:hypothetical protein SLEP1_g24663 [Rubroshorea leprosula]
MAASSAVANEPSQSLVLLLGSLISATHFPQVLCQTSRYWQEAYRGRPLLVVGPFFPGFNEDFSEGFYGEEVSVGTEERPSAVERAAWCGIM